jgi:hypothetical protein
LFYPSGVSAFKENNEELSNNSLKTSQDAAELSTIDANDYSSFYYNFFFFNLNFFDYSRKDTLFNLGNSVFF